MMKKIPFDDGMVLHNESESPSTIDLVVDYRVRFAQSACIQEAFSISLRGAKLCNRLEEAKKNYASNISGTDDESLLNACRLVWFDQVYRAAHQFGDPTDANPDHDTCENIRAMVNRTNLFLEHYGGVVESGPVFPGGYTATVVAGDGDFTTKDAMWDLKVSKNPPTSKHTLQIAMYHLMAKHSIIKSYKDLKNIGIFNPRLNIAYVIDMGTVEKNIIEDIESKVIGYN